MPLRKIPTGPDASIFLFRFVLRDDAGVDFVMNERIAADMYADVDERLKPLVQACGEALLRYKRWSAGDTIMDGHILASGECEVMLSRGRGKHIPWPEKAQLFADAGEIGRLLETVMSRRTREAQEGKSAKPFPRASQSCRERSGSVRSKPGRVILPSGDSDSGGVQR